MMFFMKMKWRDMSVHFRALLLLSLVLCFSSGSALLYQRVDTDGDGLGDLDERLLGLDPLNATDGSTYIHDASIAPASKHFFSDPLHGSPSVPLPGWLQEGGPGHLPSDHPFTLSSLSLTLSASPVS